jgi:hypothetical protein
MEFRVEIRPFAVFVRHFLWLDCPVNANRGIVPTQTALGLRGVKGAVEIKRFDMVGQRDEPVSEPARDVGMYSIERLSSVSSAPNHLR